MDARRELVIERVLRCVELVPPGRVASYGAIAAICGIGPRQVGSIMRHWSDGLPWWRGQPPSLMAHSDKPDRG